MTVRFCFDIQAFKVSALILNQNILNNESHVNSEVSYATY